MFLPTLQRAPGCGSRFHFPLSWIVLGVPITTYRLELAQGGPWKVPSPATLLSSPRSRPINQCSTTRFLLNWSSTCTKFLLSTLLIVLPSPARFHSFCFSSRLDLLSLPPQVWDHDRSRGITSVTDDVDARARTTNHHMTDCC